MAEYKFFPISVPVSEEDLTNYITIRLAMLKTNPEAFGSTFTGESKNTRETWRAKIDHEGRCTIISADASTGEWVGSASIATPEFMNKPESPNALIGMWVNPEHRRKGLAKGLIEVGMDWLRKRTDGMPDEKRMLTLEVHRTNESAKALYDLLGFRELEDTEVECPPDRIPMFIVAK
ncbi:acyl-CoA N-acyltransferase [Roridomyces roridus]|uniref:Acyl-CoA N-acyltransferase n=1 Tax=Roridomyces roridus TaxID=1738132 RepID=A0AAD7BX56_9AGAR|nr:acyl-CoA N-acyltransferase [Roridomyces roridus]